MYINSGYLNNSRTDFKDNSTPLVVGSCGTYRLKTRPKLPTYWQKGRRDYQILYVANGKTHFWFDGREEIVSAGHMVLYKPEEIQKYVYYLEDNPEVFWIHFTGRDVKNILAYHGISLDEHVFYCGVLPDYKALFRKIIQELQLCRYGYEDYIASLFNDILLLVDRQQHEQKKATGNVQEQIERAAAYFNENYNTKISIDDYAESLHISTNWFIHNFKQYAGMSPAQYILSLRMVNAQSLLERTTYNIKEISEIVGYENPLYFSRVFKKDDMGGIIPVKTIEEIENYIEEQDQNGALLVTGKWGSGKTYLIRQIEKKLNQEPKYLMAVVSLFGIEDTNTLSKKVKEAVAYAQTFNKAEKSGKGHIAKQLSEKAAAFGELFDFGKIKKIAKSANMLLSIDIHDFLPIEKEVYCIVAGEEQPVKKKLVLVFDDFERCKIGVIDLLGIINTYVEDKRSKTIVIASEDNI